MVYRANDALLKRDGWHARLKQQTFKKSKWSLILLLDEKQFSRTAINGTLVNEHSFEASSTKSR